MKKFLLFVVLLFSCILVVKGEDLTKYSKSAILLDPITNTIIYEKDKDERRAPASMTKIMTMLLIMEAIDNNKIKTSDIVTVSKEAAKMGGSTIFLEENMTISVEELLKGIAIASGNDAAVAMAEHIAGSTAEFVNMMNDKAKELNLKNTHFVNVHGLDAEDHYSSAYDMAQIARELLKHPKILEYTSVYEEYLSRPDGSKTWLVNTNKLVRFYSGVDGLKTGYTSNAGYCLTATATKNNTRFLTVVVGSDTSEHRSADTTSMLNYAFSNYKVNSILKKNDIVSEALVKNGIVDKVNLITKEDVAELVRINEEKKYSYNISTNKLNAPLVKGEKAASLKIIDNSGKTIKEIDLTVDKDVKKQNFFSILIKIIKIVSSGY